MKKWTILLMSCVLLITMSAGCKSIGTDTASNGTDTVSQEIGKSGVKIGFAFPNSDEINMNMRGTYEQYAETLEGVQLIVTSANDDAEQQAADVENLIAQNCDVIIIRPADGATIGPVCGSVVNANIPLVIDELILDTNNYTVRTPIDQADHGRVLGSYIQSLLDSGDIQEAKIGYIIGDNDQPMLGRMTGILETCTSAAFVAEGVANNWSATEAQSIVENWISSGKIEEMNIIACMDDALANAAVTALGDNYPNIIVLGAGGTNVVAMQNIANGKMMATTYLNNAILAENMLGVCIDLANGVEVKYDDPENRLLNLRSISLMTAYTISN
jgi:ABC-type sugar transport system substrate-binding protein